MGTKDKYIQKLEEYITYLIRLAKQNSLGWDISIGPRADYESELSALKAGMGKQEQDEMSRIEIMEKYGITEKDVNEYMLRFKTKTMKNDKNYIKDGEGFIEVICQRLREENILLYDSHIVQKIRTLTNGELNQIVSLGDVIDWHNDRAEKEHTKTQ